MDNTRLLRLRALMSLIYQRADEWLVEGRSMLRYERVESAYLAERDTLPPRQWDRDARLNRLLDRLDTVWQHRLLTWGMTPEADARYRAWYMAVEDALYQEES